MKKYGLTSVIWPEDDVYVSKCPELDVASPGDTKEEALKNLIEAVTLYLENVIAHDLLDEYYGQYT